MNGKNTNDVTDIWGWNSGNKHETIPHATMTVDRYASDYNMSHKKRGMAIIFNHYLFENPENEARTGTDIDCQSLTQSLSDFHFDVNVHRDLPFKEIQTVIKTASALDHSENDCILIAVLSHGNLGYICAKDSNYTLESLTSFFTAEKCPSLAGKPKLFIIQACQGKQLDGGIEMDSRIESDGNSTMSYKIPLHADFLIAYSTIPGFISWRNPEHGSCFIQYFCDELNKNGRRYDILHILTFVCQRVAIDFESSTVDPRKNRKKQMPCTTTMLTRLLKFSDKPSAE